MLKPSDSKTFYDAESLCNSICGAIYFPSTLVEYNEVFEIALKGGFQTEDIWLRLSDEETEGVWKDPDNRETLIFENWVGGQPNNVANSQHHVYIQSNSGQWGDVKASWEAKHVICELRY